MPYFNGGLHGWNGHPRTVRRGSEHAGTGFRWAPYYGGGKCCDACGLSVDRKREVSR